MHSERRRLLVRAALLVLLSLAGSSGPISGADTSYQVVVHATNPASSVSHAQLTELFLKRTDSWSGGLPARPVDLPADSPARASFSQDVLGRQVTAIKSYWQQMIFSGRGAPPPEVSSEQDVLRFVSENPGAVGYVAPGTSVGSGVKVVRVVP